MRRLIVVSITRGGGAVTFPGDDGHPDTPREILRYEYSPQGWPVGCLRIQNWQDVVAAFNQITDIPKWAAKGDLLAHNIGRGEGAVFDGSQFRPCRLRYG